MITASLPLNGKEVFYLPVGTVPYVCSAIGQRNTIDYPGAGPKRFSKEKTHPLRHRG